MNPQDSPVLDQDVPVLDPDAPLILEMRHISKTFGAVTALVDASIKLHRGEVLALVGDNGAGKSTLVNIFAGALQPSSGQIFVDGQEVSFRSALEARERGIETVYQDLALAPDLAVWANLFLGRERKAKGILGRLGWLDRKTMRREAETILERTRIRIGSVLSKAGQLSGGQRQAIAVGRAVSWGSRVLLMDEPTAALGVEQQEVVGELIKAVSAQGVPILLITHNLPQVHKLADRVAVLFHGHVVADLRCSEVTVDDMVRWITGAALGTQRHAG